MLSALCVHTPPAQAYNDSHQTDSRMGTIEVKIKKLDAELSAFKQQMAKLREGPGKVSIFALGHGAEVY